MDRELSLRMDDAEKELFKTANAIIEKYNLPFFIMEPMVDKMHRQFIDGKNREIAAAKAREAAASPKEETK